MFDKFKEIGNGGPDITVRGDYDEDMIDPDYDLAQQWVEQADELLDIYSPSADTHAAVEYLKDKLEVRDPESIVFFSGLEKDLTQKGEQGCSSDDLDRTRLQQLEQLTRMVEGELG